MHNKCNVLESSPNRPLLLRVEKLSAMKLGQVSKQLETAALKSVSMFCNFTEICTKTLFPLFIVPSFSKYLLKVFSVPDKGLPVSTPRMENNFVSKGRVCFSVLSGQFREEKLCTASNIPN